MTESVKSLEAWLTKNPVSCDFNTTITGVLKEWVERSYVRDPVDFRNSTEALGWELFEFRDTSSSKVIYAEVRTPHGRVTVYSDPVMWAEMAKSIETFNHLNKTPWGRFRLWLGFRIDAWRNKR